MSIHLLINAYEEMETVGFEEMAVVDLSDKFDEEE